MSEPRRGYTPEFTVALAKKPGYGIKKAAQELGIPLKALKTWRYPGQSARVQPPSTADNPQDPAWLQAQIRELQKQLARSEMEKEILKKATAYFAKESL